MMNIKNLSVTYEKDGVRTEAVRGIDLYVEKGKITGLVGESGSGKSTAMFAIMGLLPEQTTVMADVMELDGERPVPGKNIAMIFQDSLHCLNPTMKIGKQIAETVRAKKRCSLGEARRRAEELLEQVGIRNPKLRMKQYPYELSGGMRQRVVIAIALACEPKLIIADEPTTALDAAVQAQILLLLKKIVKETETSLLLVSHDLGVVASLCDQLYVMREGEIVENGFTVDVFYDPQTDYTKQLLADASGKRIIAAGKDVKNESPAPLLKVEHLKRMFQSGEGLEDISFEIKEGEMVALIGESGSGKTTLARILTGIESSDGGMVVGKKDCTVRMVFQDPFASLNPCMTVRQTLREVLLVQKITEEKIKSDIEEMIVQVGLHLEDLERYPKELSGGQRQRVAIARALLAQPKLLIFDEAFSAVDATTRAQLMELLAKLVKQKKIACLFISHDLELVKWMTTKVYVLYKGALLESGPAAAVCQDPWHPYTKMLMEALPKANPKKAKKIKPGTNREFESKGGCPYFSQCGYALDCCKNHRPETYVFEERKIACYLYSQKHSGKRGENYKMTSQI